MTTYIDTRVLSRLRRALTGAIGLLGLLVFVGCTTTSSEPGAAFRGDGKIASNTLAEGDVISISFPAATELNQSQKIRLDGKISLPMVGEVTAAGKSPSILQDELTAKYDEHLQDSKVIVSLASSAAVVYVSGAVRSPGKVLLDRQITVFEAIMESGGFSEVANPKKVILIRQQDGKRHRRVLNLKDETENEVVYVKPFDTIIVRESTF